MSTKYLPCYTTAIHQSQPPLPAANQHGSFHLPLHLTLPHMSSINLLIAQPWAGKGYSPVSLLWTNPGCSYNPALKKEQLGGSQTFYQCRAACSWLCAYRGVFQLWGASARLLLDSCTHPQQTQPEVPSTGLQLFRLPQVYRAYTLKPVPQHGQECSGTHHRKQRAADACCLEWKTTSF